MQAALDMAHKSYQQGEVPIGAVIVCANQVISSASNTCESDKNALQHAEIKAIEQAANHKNNWRLSDCDLYVTLEPCPMCLGALFQARIQSLHIGCFDPKRNESSYVKSLQGLVKLTDNNHTLQITTGILQDECSQILKEFFKEKR